MELSSFLLVLGLLLKRPQGGKAAAPCPTLCSCLCYLCLICFVISLLLGSSSGLTASHKPGAEGGKRDTLLTKEVSDPGTMFPAGLYVGSPLSKKLRTFRDGSFRDCLALEFLVSGIIDVLEKFGVLVGSTNFMSIY